MRLAAATLLLLTVFASLGSAQLINRRAPSFSLPDSAFKQYDILDYRGKWLLIYFMQTIPATCPKCRPNSAKLEGVMKKFGTTANMFSIVITPPDNQQTVAKYVQENKITSPMLFDQSQVAIAYFKATPANPSIPVPHLFVVNPQGTITRDFSSAAMDSPTFTADLEAVLAGSATKPPAKAK